jgi:hypothetical protein
MVCDNELIGKTIIKAEVGGYGIKLWLDDDMIFDFKASDGGYSCWELYPRSKMEEQEYAEPEINPCRGCSDYDGEGGCKSSGACGAKMENDNETN